MKNDGYFKYLVFITQIGITMLSPIALCMGIAIYLTRKFHLGQWVIILAILLGVLAGALNVYKIMMSAIKKK